MSEMINAKNECAAGLQHDLAVDFAMSLNESRVLPLSQFQLASFLCV